MKLFLPIIAYGGQVHTEYMISMMNLMQSLIKNNMSATFHPITSESLISRGRNSAAAFFLQSDSDYMLFVDTDMSLTGGSEENGTITLSKYWHPSNKLSNSPE